MTSRQRSAELSPWRSFAVAAAVLAAIACERGDRGARTSQWALEPAGSAAAASPATALEPEPGSETATAGPTTSPLDQAETPPGSGERSSGERTTAGDVTVEEEPLVGLLEHAAAQRDGDAAERALRLLARETAAIRYRGLSPTLRDALFALSTAPLDTFEPRVDSRVLIPLVELSADLGDAAAIERLAEVSDREPYQRAIAGARARLGGGGADESSIAVQGTTRCTYRLAGVALDAGPHAVAPGSHRVVRSCDGDERETIYWVSPGDTLTLQ